MSGKILISYGTTHEISVLTLCILMDFPIHIDTISIGLPIVYFKGSLVDFSNLSCISLPDDCFNCNKQCRP